MKIIIEFDMDDEGDLADYETFKRMRYNEQILEDFRQYLRGIEKHEDPNSTKFEMVYDKFHEIIKDAYLE